MNTKIFLLRWLVCWAQLIDGLTGVLTFGLIRTSISLPVVKIYSRSIWRNQNDNVSG